MGTNISFGDYFPDEDPKGVIDIRIGVFFDGTQNNRTNTSARSAKEGSDAKNAYNEMSDKKTDSYMNDLSNVARKELHYAKGAYVDSVYIEGIGTDDLGTDTDDTTTVFGVGHLGVAYGSGTQGIIAKVTKGCDELAKMAKKLKGKDKINILTVDVFGFSRGSAAARNFIYELSKNKSHDIWGSHLVKHKVQYTRLQVRFVGLYDTVSSFDPNATNTSTGDPNFDNDVSELHLNDLNLEINNLYKAKKIIHFCADDEHRKNFMLTPTAKRAGGQDFYLPGVHSDIGGCYTDKMDELNFQIMDLDNYYFDGRKDKEYDEILNNDLDNLMAQGWGFSKIGKADSDHQTFMSRYGIRNTYSFVTLHLMVEKLNKEYAETIKMTDLNKYFGIPKPNKPDELDLNKVKQRLEKYINGELPKITYYTQPQIEQMQKKLDLKNVKDVASFKIKVYDHNMLKRLRSKYIHWNSKFGDGIGAYEPNYKISGKTIVRFRKKEPNS